MGLYLGGTLGGISGLKSDSVKLLDDVMGTALQSSGEQAKTMNEMLGAAQLASEPTKTALFARILWVLRACHQKLRTLDVTGSLSLAQQKPLAPPTSGGQEVPYPWQPL